MLLNEKTDVDGWNVEFTCTEFKPDGWLPSQQQKYAVYATAELRRSAQFPPGWTAPILLRFPQQGFAAVFDNDRDGHDAAIAELTARFQSFKSR